MSIKLTHSFIHSPGVPSSQGSSPLSFYLSSCQKQYISLKQSQHTHPARDQEPFVVSESVTEREHSLRSFTPETGSAATCPFLQKYAQWFRGQTRKRNYSQMSVSLSWGALAHTHTFPCSLMATGPKDK